ncbi:MAG: CAAX prenyl protease-related protein [Planctomycetaceae bacterium]|nr:CAAX prenyl protease-related protein [Planctomycetaceae bacterium]
MTRGPEGAMPVREHALKGMIPYIAPFALFMVLTSIESQGWLGLRYETLYTLKTIAVAGALWCFRREYPRFATGGLGLAVIAGGLGCLLWVGLARLQAITPGLQPLIDSLLGGRAGYDPTAGDAPYAARAAFVCVRLVGLTAIVPIMEELFWRGFLARYLIDDDFRNVPQGKFTRSSFLIVTAAFAAVHPEILAAVAWGALINGLYHKTQNLWACVAMHAVTNGLLGAYILATGNWQFW